MGLDTAADGSREAELKPGNTAQYHQKHPKRLIFAPGDIAAPPSSASQEASQPTSTSTPTPTAPETKPHHHHPSHLSASISLEEATRSGTSTPLANATVVSQPSRAHQFITNPPLTFSQLHHTNPLHQFHTWFRDDRLLPASAPETCTLATASMPSGRVSARIVYLKELDERGWVVYSNWGSKAGKGGQVFGGVRAERNCAGDGEGFDSVNGEGEVLEEDIEQLGNRWAGLTFNWPTVERQVRVEGLVETLSREESETYWRVRERGSQIGAWASQQSRVLWSTEPLDGDDKKTGDGEGEGEDYDDGRIVLENRVKEVEARFSGTQDIPLPPFWGGVRIVPESIEFWQGRKSRLHDRFKYVRVHGDNDGGDDGKFRWRVQRLSP